MAFSNKSKELRYEYGLTQLQLAQALKISRSCISMIEIGKNEPTATTLIAYANFFNLPIDELLERTETSAPPTISTTYPFKNEVMNFSQTAKELREEINLSQKALSQKLGISSAAVGHLEIGRNEPTASTIIAYAKFFNISADELLGISDSMEQNAGNVMHATHSSEEMRLLDIYRTLSPDMRQTLWSLLETWTPTISNKNKA